MATGNGQASASHRRRVVAEIVAACVVILLLAQGLTGLLTLAAYNRLAVTASAERAELIARDTAARIETGLRLGKPLTQYFGLVDQLDRSLAQMPGLTGASVVLADGYVLATWGQPPPATPALIAAGIKPTGQADEGAGVERLASGTAMQAINDVVVVAVPLSGRAAQPDGALLLGVSASDAGQSATHVRRSLFVLGLTTPGLALLLIVVLGGVIPYATLTRPGGKLRLIVPLMAIILAQALYAADTISSFRNLWLGATRSNVEMLSGRMQQDLQRVLDMGIEVDRLRGVDQWLGRLARNMPAIGAVELHAADGAFLAGADASGPLQASASPPDLPDDLRIRLPLHQAGGDNAPLVGVLDVQLAPEVIESGVMSRVLDAATVALVSAIVAFEMFLLLALLVNRSANSHGRASQGYDDRKAQVVARISRPVMFAFLFAWAMPLSFVPLYTHTLATSWLVLPDEILMALPLSAEMLLGLVGALWAGRLVDGQRWRIPVLGGMVLAGVGSALAAFAHSVEAFTLARAVVGLGYGLAWMGLQGFVVIGSSPEFRGRNMAWLFAGLFAGHLSGTVTGAMLADQTGYRTVFLVSAVWMIAALLGAALLGRHRPIVLAATDSLELSSAAASPSLTQRAAGAAKRVRVRSLLASRDFVALMLGSIVPFSIVQVGLLYFALPIYLQAQGVSSAGIGRVLMLYGLCMIYLGPAIGRLVDGMPGKTWFITLGAVLGGGGMAWLYLDNSLFTVCVAVVLLALGSCFSGAAQTAWMLSLPAVQKVGAGAATSVMRAADKLGQMIGPLFVGAWFTVVDMGPGLAITGLFYVVAALVFLVVVGRRSGHSSGP